MTNDTRPWGIAGQRHDKLEDMVAVRDAEIASLKAKLDEACFKLGVHADASEISGMSWSGFNIIGDKKSIREIERIENRSSQLEVYQREFDNRISALKAKLAEAGEATAEWKRRAFAFEPNSLKLLQQQEVEATALRSRVEKLEAAARRAERFLKPFSDSVFNDNGDMTVTNPPSLGHDDYCNAYLVAKALRAALTDKEQTV